MAIATASLLSLSAQAQTVNTPLDSADVRANIASSCFLSVTPLAFGSYMSIGANATNALDAQGTVSVTCTAGTTGLVASLMQGNGSGATCNTTSPVRSMKHTTASEWLSYSLFQDEGRTLEWGCNAANQVTYPEFINSGTPVVRTVYGRIPPGQYKTVGNYTDSIQFYVVF